MKNIKTVKIMGIDFIVFPKEEKGYPLVSKDIVYNVKFGDTSVNFRDSELFWQLNCLALEFLYQGIHLEKFNLSLVSYDTDDVDDLSTYKEGATFGTCYTDIGVPNIDFYLKYKSIFDLYESKNLEKGWEDVTDWWLATATSVNGPWKPSVFTVDGDSIGCISPEFCSGVRPLIYLRELP